MKLSFDPYTAPRNPATTIWLYVAERLISLHSDSFCGNNMFGTDTATVAGSESFFDVSGTRNILWLDATILDDDANLVGAERVRIGGFDKLPVELSQYTPEQLAPFVEEFVDVAFKLAHRAVQRKCELERLGAQLIQTEEEYIAISAGLDALSDNLVDDAKQMAGTPRADEINRLLAVIEQLTPQLNEIAGVFNKFRESEAV